MAAPQRNAEKVIRSSEVCKCDNDEKSLFANESAENLLIVSVYHVLSSAIFLSHQHMDSFRRSLDKLLSLSTEDGTETEMLRSRINEQSSMICILKQRADELTLQCQALQKINTEQGDGVTDHQRELDSERKKAELIERRFNDLAANNQAIIVFMDEHKSQNAQLKMENKRLQSENDTLFSQKLQDKEVLVQKLMKEIQRLTEDYTNKSKDYQKNLTECQSKLLEEATQHKAKEASLLDQLHDTEQQQREAVEMCKELRLKLQTDEEKNTAQEINMKKRTRLIKEKEELLSLSIERGRVIQEKQEEIQQLERKWKKEKKSRTEAEDKFEQDAETVNADVKVQSLKCALNDSATKYQRLQKDFDAFREHSASLLTQERELNKKLRHMIG
ncbi:coiled-coil domain-containing protein 89 [Pleuronectes platessa]|uniref:coiled-coil domain-containing protein 89 n=1 Tax=Pleuronectes platessa TaxID=8262 RepID=UPI00232A144E|nr:coiled-coil domain-containing protein 89 [Pleuronectes platessa]